MYLGAAALLVGCGQGALRPAKPSVQPDIETRAAPVKPLRDMPRLIAPPPAYGNKIVMARADGDSSSN